jgi:hypothetical protein
MLYMCVCVCVYVFACVYTYAKKNRDACNVRVCILQRRNVIYNVHGSFFWSLCSHLKKLRHQFLLAIESHADA